MILRNLSALALFIIYECTYKLFPTNLFINCFCTRLARKVLRSRSLLRLFRKSSIEIFILFTYFVFGSILRDKMIPRHVNTEGLRARSL